MKNKKYLIHLYVWLGLVLLRVLMNSENSIWENLFINGVLYTLNAGIFYSTALLYRHYGKKQKLYILIPGMIVIFFGFIIIMRLSFGVINFATDLYTPLGVTKFSFIRVTIWMLLAFLYQSIIRNHKGETQRRELLLEKKETELQYLKTQMNPHFFFNTLNNLYGLTYNKDDKAPKVVLMLSDAMRYIIYETHSDFVTLNKEIGFIKNYIELEKLRTPNSSNIHFSTSIDQSGYKIAPLILLPFIENCFKHSNINISKEAYIDIKIWKEKETLCFSCANSTDISYPSVSGGIGTQNVLKRLNLIYPGKYKLESKKDGEEYFVFLEIPLTL